MTTVTRRRSVVVSVLATLVFLLLIAAGMSRLATHADRDWTVAAEVTALQGQVQAISALGWKSVASERAAATDVVEVDRTLNDAKRRMAWLRARTGSSALARFDAALRDYSSGIRREFALLPLGRLGDAEEVDETRVDPAFDRVQEAATKAVASHRANARAPTAQARTASR